jgi:RecB family endonuclease NucS
MSEWKWIDRKEQQPAEGDRVLMLFKDRSWGLHIWGDRQPMPTHWMPILPPPPRMVTIEISEKAAGHYSKSDSDAEDYKEVVFACRAALAKREGK